MFVLGCSGGPDSMALLDLERKKGTDLLVCHVNYHKRDTADRDEAIVRDYCARHGLTCLVHEAGTPSGNFQDWARKERYDFFAKQRPEGILVAHQQDDVLETYIMQKQRHAIPDFYGIKETGSWKGIPVLRPLLDKTKAELETYCQENGIPYGIDESNLADGYTRNRIRHQGIENRKELLDQMDESNRALQKRRAKAQEAVEACTKDGQMTDALLEASWFDFEWWFFKTTGLHLSKAQALSLTEQLHKDTLVEVSGWWLERHQGSLYLVPANIPVPVTIHSEKDLASVYWNGYGFAAAGKTIEGFHVKESDFPLVLRGARPGDAISMRFGKKKLGRFFVDRKVPRHLRFGWPVIETAGKEVAFVAGLGCGASYYHPQGKWFMIKLISPIQGDES